MTVVLHIDHQPGSLTYEDQHDIERTLNGDQRAFAALVDRYKFMVFTLSLRLTGNRELAEEAAQDSFLKAYKSLRKFKGHSKFSSWLYRIAYNTSLDAVKKRKRGIEVSEVDDPEYAGSAVAAGAESVLDRMERDERGRAVRSIMKQLDGEVQFILTLFYYEELTMREIAEIMDITRNNAKVKLYRSRQRLAELICTNDIKKELWNG